MKKIIKYLFNFNTFHRILFIIIIIGCKRFDDTYLKVKVIDRSDSTSVGDIEIKVTKRKPSIIWGYNVVDIYYGRTNSNGECTLKIDNYNRKKYEFSVDVNMYEGNPPNFGGYTYSIESKVLQEYELKDDLIVKLRKIPIPDNINH